MNDEERESYGERIYEAWQENRELRERITYLQEEVASLEDEVRRLQDLLEKANNIEI